MVTCITANQFKQVIVGTLVVVGSALSYLSPIGIWLAAVMGAGLLFSGLTDSCVMGMFLSRMPWNQASATCEAASNDRPAK